MAVSFNSYKANSTYLFIIHSHSFLWSVQGRTSTVAKAQRSVETVLNMTSETKLDYDMRQKHGEIQICFEVHFLYMWALTMCTVYWIIMNLCKIMQDTEHCAITQTIHTNHIWWVCSVKQASSPRHLA